MNTFTITLPVTQMKTALSAVEEAHRVHTAIDEEEAALPAINAVEHGTLAIKKREEDLAAFVVRKKEATAKAARVIEAAFNSAVEDVDRQTLPSGADITGENEPDFKLLQYGLVNTPTALAKLAEKHLSPAFRAMVQKYAEAREWDGFTFHDKEQTVREFVNDFFNQCMKAAEKPSGYYGMLLMHDNEIERQASASGLQAEYLKAVENVA